MEFITERVEFVWDDNRRKVAKTEERGRRRGAATLFYHFCLLKY